MSSQQVNPGILYVKNITLNTAACDAVHDTLLRINNTAASGYEEPFIFFYYKEGALQNIALNQIALYEKDGSSLSREHTGFVFCNDYFVHSQNGHIYDMNGTEIIGYPCWCPQVTGSNEILFIKLDDGGIYKYTPSVPATTGRVGDVVLKHNWIQYWGGSEILIWDEWSDSGTAKKGLRRIDFSGNATGVVKEGIDEVQSFQRYGSDALLYLDADFRLHTIQISTGVDQVFIPEVLQFCVHNNELYYIKQSDCTLQKETA